VDILEGPLSALNSKAKLAKIMNIQTQVADVTNGTKILANSCDLVLMTNLLFQCENKKAILEEGKRVLKQSGRILLIDWKKSASFGPRDRAVSPEEIKKLVEEVGLKTEKPALRSLGEGGEFEASPYHYGIMLGK